MLKFHAHDTVNDVALIQTGFGYRVRYGLDVTECDTLEEAVRQFSYCQMHALRCAGAFRLEGEAVL